MFSWLEELFEKDWRNVAISQPYSKDIDKWERASDQHGIRVRYKRDFVDGREVTLVYVPARYLPKIRELGLVR